MSSPSPPAASASGASAASASAPLSAADAADVAILETTLYRFASTDDEKLEATVARVLPKLLPLFLRPAEPIRAQMMLICNHVLKRLQALPTLRLPVAELLALYREHGSGPEVAAGSGGGGYFVTFTLMFIEKGMARLAVAERAQLAHELLPGLALRAPAQQKTLLHTFFRCLSPAEYNVDRLDPAVLNARWDTLRSSPADQKVLLDFMLDALVWAPTWVAPPPRGIPGIPQPMPTIAGAAAAAASASGEEKQPEIIPEGLSPAALAVLTLDGTLPSSALQGLKAAVLHFLTHCDVFTQQQMLPLAIAGSSVGSSDVVHVGEALLKRLKNLDLEDVALIQRLFDMYLGNEAPATPVAQRRKPAPYVMKVKLLNYLSRSRASVGLLQSALRVIMDTLFHPQSTPKLKHAGLMYTGWVMNQISNSGHMNSIAPVLLNALLKFLASVAKPAPASAAASAAGVSAEDAADSAADASARESKTSTGIIQAQLRGEVYQLIGQLSLKRPDLFNTNLKMLSLFFRALQDESNESVLQNIHDGLSQLRSAYVGVNESVSEQLQLVLLSMLANPTDRRVRLNALQCFNRLFPFHACLPRYANLLLSTEPTLEMKDEVTRGLTPFIPRNELVEERKKVERKREQARKEEEAKKRKEAAMASSSTSATAGGAGAAALAAEEKSLEEDEAKSPSVPMDTTSPTPTSPSAAAASSSSSTPSLPASAQPHALLSLLLPIEAAKTPCPDFSSLTRFAHAHILRQGVPSSADGVFSPSEVNQISFLKNQLAFDVRALPRLLDFLYDSLKQNAFYAREKQECAAETGAGGDAMEDVSSASAGSKDSGKAKTAAAATGLTDDEIHSLVSRYVGTLIAADDAAGTPAPERALLQFQSLIEHALEQRIHDVQSSASQHLVRVVSLRPGLFAPVYAARLGWIETNMISGIQNLRSAMAELLSLISSHLQPDAVVSSLLQSFQGHLSAAEKVVGPSRDDVTHGCILALGVLVAEAMKRNKSKGVDADSDEASQGSAAFPVAQLSSTVLEIARRLDAATFGRTPHITAAAIISLGRIGEVGRLPIPVGKVEPAAPSAAAAAASATPAAAAGTTSPVAAAADKSASASLPSTVPTTRSAIVSQLLAMLRGTERKAERVVEESIKTLSLLCVGDRSNVLLNEVVEGFVASANTKHEEIHFAIGEALSTIAKTHQHPLPASAASAAPAPSPSPSPPPGENKMDTSSTPAAPATAASPAAPTIPEGADMLYSILPRLFKLVGHGSTLQRTAACTWLLCLCKYSWSLPAVQKFFDRIQASFSICLTDSSQFIQEVAAKGMAVLYEHSSGATQQELIDSLMRTFSSGQRKVQADTLITLDEEKGEFSTYKELVDVAKDMNKPDLVYSFMDLAAHHSIWSSKLGAAFSLSSMLAVNSQLGNKLGAILPKLYRYQFDTNKKIQDSMKKMWLSLVLHPREAINEHFGPIMEDLLHSMGERQYRVRNSACLALSELIQGRGMDQLGPYLDRLWSNSFRLLDDVNEHVRKSATQLSGTLSHLSIRLCDTVYSNRAAAQKALGIVLPVLLQQGVTSKAKEIQSVSIRSVLALIKIGGANLKPHLPTLVETLLQGMTNLEPALFSYYQQHAAGFGMTDEQLERARLSVSSGGPLAEALSSCLLVVDDESIPPLLAKITDIISTGLGLPTLTGAAKFVMSLVASKSGPAMRDHVAPLIQQLQKGLQDQSPTLRKYYADALGFLCKVAKKKRVEKLLVSLLEMYTNEKSSETSRLVSGFALRSIVRQAGDVVRANFMLEVVPVTWVGSHDNTPANPDIAKAWSETLEELIPGLDAGIPLYQKECLDLIKKLVESPVYSLRHIALLALKHLILACKARFGEEVETLLPLIIKLLPGRLWTGKEVALDVIVFLAQEAGSRFTATQARSALEALRQECTRAKSEYKREAIRCVGKVALCFPYLKGAESIEPMRPILQPILDLTASSTKSDAATAGGAAASSGAASTATAAATPVAPAAFASSSSSSAASADAKAGGEKETGPDVLLVTYSYACLADLLPSPQAAVNALYLLRQGKPGSDADAGVSDEDWVHAQRDNVDWIVNSLIGGLEKGFAWTVRVAIWTGLKRVVENVYGGEDLAPTTAGNVAPKRSFGPSLLSAPLVGSIGQALVGSHGLAEPKFPAVRARAIELLHAIAETPAAWSALVADSNAAAVRTLNTQLIGMRADTDATVLRLAPSLQTKLASASAAAAAAGQ